jgi:serine/threonine protein kinase/predicted ATPase
MDPAPDELVAGRFRVEREVGRGGVGIVYRAFDTVTRRPVALKIVAAAGADQAEHARFAREGQLLAELDHPGIVRVIAFGTLEAGSPGGTGRPLEDSVPYVAMEWLEGEDVAARQLRAPLSLRQALSVGAQVARALAAAHQAGVVHRDIKPSNVFLLGGASRDSAPPVSGLAVQTPGRISRPSDPVGVARFRAGPLPRAERVAPEATPSERAEVLTAKLVDFGVAAADDIRLTRTGAVVGTPAYMAPEQARGDSSADARSDIYSLGATLFELVAGRPPHIGPTSIATLARLVTTPAPRLSELLVGVPEPLDELVEQMLSHNRDRRPASAMEVALALEALERDPALPDLAKAQAEEAESKGVLGTRLVTTLVALHVATGAARVGELERLGEQGADALPLGTDSIVAHFGARRAHGEEAPRALEIGRALCARGARVGVATGRTRVDLTRSAGDVVDRASALARDAGAGRLVADAITIELARGRFELELRVDGSAVVGAALRGRREAGALTPFVGREAELASTMAAYERCVEDHVPIVVSVSGPPGIGKSRLAREFALRVGARSDRVRMIQVRCDAYGRAQALGVASDALRALLGLPKGASLEQAREAVEARHLRYDGGGLLAPLLANQPFPDGVDQRGARDALYLSMTELVLGAATTEPCAILLEDAQWSDPESIAWVDHLLGRATGRPLFAMLMLRPAFWRDQPQRFAGRDHVRVELRPMARRATREIARAVIGVEADDAMLDRVAQQAAGSPLFAEELARVIAAGKDAGSAATIEAAIQVSLDALDDTTREAVVRMSVFGLSAWDAGMAAVGVADPALTIRRLLAAELVVENAASRFSGTREVLFKHALVREVAYASAGEELRSTLHTQAARWLASMGEDAATVAQHFDLGGRHEEAAAHWEAAARRALATNSLGDAVAMAERSVAFASDRPTAFGRAVLLDEAYSRLDARSSERDSAIRAMAESVFDEASELRTMGARARFDDACGSGLDIEERLSSVRERARSLDLVDEEARCSATLAHRFAYAGQLASAEAEAAHLIELADRRGIVWAAVDAWQTLAVVRQTRGELATALEARRSAARAARSAGLQEREAMLTMNLGFALTTIGAKQEALGEIEAGLAKAGAIGSAGAVRHGQMVLLGWAAAFGADARLDAALAEPRTSADEAAGGMWVVRDRTTLGVLFYRGCELLRGDAAVLPRARALLKTAAEAYRSTENRDVLPVALGFWAEAERRLGNAEQAIEIAREAAALVEGGAPSLLNEAPIYLALHDGCVDVGDLRCAREAMERAIPPLLRRLKGLEGTPYARPFLLRLPHNAGLLAAAEAYGCIPEELERILEAKH